MRKKLKHSLKLNRTLVAEKKAEKPSKNKTESTVAKKSEKVESKEEKGTSYKSANPGSNLLLSTLVPGWGLTRLSDGKPYWLIGILGYGCIASSVYLNVQASSNYDKYVSSTQADEFDSYYDTGKKQYTASNVLALSAVAIWVADLGITWIKASKMKKSAVKNRTGSFSVGSSYDYSVNTTTVSFFYTF